MEKLGRELGILFQLQDDILDITGNEKEMGKMTGSDQKNLKASIPAVLGLDKAKELLFKYKRSAKEQIEGLSSNKEFFIELLDFISNRIK